MCVANRLVHTMEASLVELGLPPAVVQALEAARIRRNELMPEDPRRATTEQFLADCMQRLSQTDIGQRPRLPARRRNFVGEKSTDARRSSREAAYTAMEALLAAAWPPINNADKQLRKRQKQQHQHEAARAAASAQPAASSQQEQVDKQADVEMPLASGASCHLLAFVVFCLNFIPMRRCRLPVKCANNKIHVPAGRASGLWGLGARASPSGDSQT